MFFLCSLFENSNVKHYYDLNKQNNVLTNKNTFSSSFYVFITSKERNLRLYSSWILYDKDNNDVIKFENIEKPIQHDQGLDTLIENILKLEKL